MDTITIDNRLFGRIVSGGNVAVFESDGSAATRIDASVWPIGSDLSARYEHPAGIVLTADDAARIGIEVQS